MIVGHVSFWVPETVAFALMVTAFVAVTVLKVAAAGIPTPEIGMRLLTNGPVIVADQTFDENALIAVLALVTVAVADE